MKKSYYIGAYWGARDESIESLSQRTERFFRFLNECDPSLTHWYEKGYTLEEALAYPVKTNALSIEGNFHQQARTEGRMSGEGFRLGLWNGEPADGGLGISIYCGEASPWVSNVCVINPPIEGPLTERLFTPLALTKILRAMVLAWDPDWGTAAPYTLLDLLPELPKESLTPGWLTYLSHRRGPLPALPPPIHVEPVEGLGSLVLLTPERFTVSNPAHLALARDVTQRLSHAGLLSPLRPWGD